VSEVVSDVGDVFESEVIKMKSIQSNTAKGVATEVGSSRPKKPNISDTKKNKKATANARETAGYEVGSSESEDTTTPDTDVSFTIIVFTSCAVTHLFSY
jgi:hypothetical protein